MIDIKCGYNNCKHGGEVSKEEGIKIGTRWFHKECAKEKELKKEIEDYWFKNINPGTVIQILRKAINDLAKLYDADYILWVVKSCKPKGIKISHPMGLKSLCSDNRFLDEWKKIKINQKLNYMGDEFQKNINPRVSEVKYVNRSKNFLRIL